MAMDTSNSIEKVPETSIAADQPSKTDNVTGKVTKKIGLKGHSQFDAAADYLRAHEGEFGDFTEEETRKVLWKVDLRVIPILLVTITFAAVDVSSSK